MNAETLATAAAFGAPADSDQEGQAHQRRLQMLVQQRDRLRERIATCDRLSKDAAFLNGITLHDLYAHQRRLQTHLERVSQQLEESGSADSDAGCGAAPARQQLRGG